MKKRNWFYYLSSLTLCLFYSSFSNAENTNTQTLMQAVESYQQALKNEDLSAAAIKAAIAYQLANQKLSPEDKSWQIITDDYAYLLMASNQTKKAIPVLQNLLAAKESLYGNFAKELMVPLKSLVASSKEDKELNKQYSLRYKKLALRHHSDHYVNQYKDQPLKSTQQAKNLASKLRRITGKNYQVTDGGKWDFIYNVDSDQDVTAILAQMELGYRSSLGFLFAFNVLSKPASNKFKAIFFETRADYKDYLHDFRSSNMSEGAERSAGMYIGGSVKSLLLFNRSSKNEERNNFNELNTLRHEIAHQVFFELGLHSKSVRYPRWLIEGFAESFEFQHKDQLSGPHTNNISYSLLKRMKVLREKNKVLPLQKLVALSPVSERNTSSTKDIYYTGSLLVRYLYKYEPEKFKKYIADFSRRETESSGKRLALFTRHLGSPETLQNKFDSFITDTIKAAEIAKQNTKN